MKSDIYALIWSGDWLPWANEYAIYIISFRDILSIHENELLPSNHCNCIMHEVVLQRSIQIS